MDNQTCSASTEITDAMLNVQTGSMDVFLISSKRLLTMYFPARCLRLLGLLVLLIALVTLSRQLRLPQRPKHAFATLLAGTTSDGNMTEPYFIAARMLTYQLRHAKTTRGNRPDIPFLVAVLPDCHPAKRAQLERDGATIVEVQPIDPGWVVADEERWKQVFAKLRFWQMTEYDRICFIDADTILTAPLDGIFDDDEISSIAVVNEPAGIKSDEAPLPTEYAFAAITQTWIEHDFPPGPPDFEEPQQLNGGLFILAPSITLFEYYISLLRLPGRFPDGLAEQGLLNYAHRREGNMPWRPLRTHWNVMAPTLGDLRGGAVSLHDKWWSPRNEEIRDAFLSIRWQMEGFFEGRAAAKRRNW